MRVSELKVEVDSYIFLFLPLPVPQDLLLFENGLKNFGRTTVAQLDKSLLL